MPHFGTPPAPQVILPAAGAVVEARGDSGDTAAKPPSSKARRNAPKQKRKSAAPKKTRKGGKPALRRERIRVKKPRKITALRMDDPDWPWPLHLCEMRQPIWNRLEAADVLPVESPLKPAPGHHLAR